MNKSFIKGIMLSLVIMMMPIGAYGETSIEDMDLSSQRAIVMDVDTGEVIFSLNSEEKVQMASTTKLMTGLLLAENRKKEDLITFTELAMEQPSTSIYKDLWLPLQVGDKFTAEDVMKGLLLRSGNDMAYMIAQDIADDPVEFSKLMDERAAEIGMKNTDFYTPTGLDMEEVLNGENHYSTAYDMALLTIEALKNPWVKEVVGTKKTDIGFVGGARYEIINSNANLGIDGNIGGKTGFTSKAGRCLTSIYEVDGRTLVGVVLGGESPDFFQDMDKIIKYGVAKEKETVYSSGDELYVQKEEVRPLKFIGDFEEVEIPLYIKEDVQWYNNDYNKKYRTYDMNLKEIDPWNIEKDAVVGEFVITDNNSEKVLPIYTKFSTEEYVKANKELYVKVFTFAMLVLIAFIIITVVLICKRKKERI
ncbi:D-alanyl-D-alanine carboxypeptidase family protein [Clostridium culturomicium]|uniref:D-alanyl-D-alanine carboxypeptidase family protein n=1 Tax=Clostridium culturomicium TaxID=1499683 RepID=UPI000693B29B|nr:serine hydrolase [Clostridium culturomicium]